MPPVYGQVASGSPWPAKDAPPQWLGELNLDPRHRAAAGMGTEIVRADQEALMASAWDQFEALRKANQLLCQLQLARSVTRSTLTRHVAAVDGAGTFLQLTRPLHARVRLDPGSTATLASQLGSSRIATGAVSPAFRRLARPRGPLGRRLFVGATGASRIVERINAASDSAGAIVIVGPRVPPAGTVLVDNVSTATTSADLSQQAVSAAAGWASVTSPTTGGVLVPGGDQPSSGGVLAPADATPTTGGVLASDPATPVSGLLPVTATGIPNWHTDPNAPGWLNQGEFASMPDSPDFPTDPAKFEEMGDRFRAAASQVVAYIGERSMRPDLPEKPPLASKLASAETLVLAALNPDVTLVARAAAQVVLPVGGDQLRPLLGAPEFPKPMAQAPAWRRTHPGGHRRAARAERAVH